MKEISCTFYNDFCLSFLTSNFLLLLTVEWWKFCPKKFANKWEQKISGNELVETIKLWEVIKALNQAKKREDKFTFKWR